MNTKYDYIKNYILSYINEINTLFKNDKGKFKKTK